MFSTRMCCAIFFCCRLSSVHRFLDVRVLNRFPLLPPVKNVSMLIHFLRLCKKVLVYSCACISFETYVNLRVSLRVRLRWSDGARAQLSIYSFQGCMVIRPWGMAVWDELKDAMNIRIKESGAQNAYFPLFIPMSFLSKVRPVCIFPCPGASLYRLALSPANTTKSFP